MTQLSSFVRLVIEIGIAILIYFCIFYIVFYFFSQYNREKKRNQRMERENAQGQRADTRTSEGCRVNGNGFRERNEDLRRDVDFEDLLKQIAYDETDTLGSRGFPSDSIIGSSPCGLDEELQLPPFETSDELELPACDHGELSLKLAEIRLGIRDGEAGDTYKQPVIVEKEDGELKIEGTRGKIYYVVPAKTILVESDCIDSALHTCFSFEPKPVFDGDCHKYKMSVKYPAKLIKQGNTYSLLSSGGIGVILLERIG